MMLKDILVIELTDQGGYQHTSNLKDLNIDCKISSIFGCLNNESFDKPFGGEVYDTYTLQQKDTYFFLPGATVPRIKLKDVMNTHKVRVVRDIESASHIFIGSQTLDAMLSAQWKYFINTQDIKDFLEAAHSNGHMDIYYYDKVKTALEFYTNDVVITNWAAIRLMDDEDIPFSVNVTKGSIEHYQTTFRILNDDYKELVAGITGKDLYTEDSLLEYLNGKDSVTIDKTMFETLCDMFSSDDKDNHTLAMEIMANSNYKASLAYLGILFQEFGHVMDNMHTKRHVNFKSLTNYLGINYLTNVTKDHAMAMLITKKVVTPQNVAILLKHYADEISQTGSTEYFEVKYISVSSEVDEILNRELILKVKDNYVPQETQTPVLDGTTEG